MPENVPPKETAKADALPKDQAPGVARESIKGDTPTPGPGAPTRAAAPNAPGFLGDADDLDVSPGPDFVKIRWLNKIGGHEADVEWAEVRRANNLVGSGHAEIVEEKGGK